MGIECELRDGRVGLRDGEVEDVGGWVAGPMRGMGCMWKVVMTYLLPIGKGIPPTQAYVNVIPGRDGARAWQSDEIGTEKKKLADVEATQMQNYEKNKLQK